MRLLLAQPGNPGVVCGEHVSPSPPHPLKDVQGQYPQGRTGRGRVSEMVAAGGSRPGAGHSPGLTCPPRPSASCLSTPTLSFKLRTVTTTSWEWTQQIVKESPHGVSTQWAGVPEPEMEMTALFLKRRAGGEGSTLSGEVEPTCLQPSLAMRGGWGHGQEAGLLLQTSGHQPRAAGSAHETQEDTAHPDLLKPQKTRLGSLWTPPPWGPLGPAVLAGLARESVRQEATPFAENQGAAACPPAVPLPPGCREHP